MEITNFLEFRDKLLPSFNEYLNSQITKDVTQPDLREAMLYAVNSGGKRVRPMLMLATVYSSGIKFENLNEYFDLAGAIELIHTYSLIHDDLPEMDNSDIRRGKPTVHKKFNAAIAVLAGDALLTQAFYWISKSKLDASRRMAAIRVLSHNAGPMGMVAGQVKDMDSENKKLSFDELVELHNEKTGDLIVASVTMGATTADHSLSINLVEYAKKIGLAFQIKDDIDDFQNGEDQNKNTFPNLLGINESEDLLSEYVKDALNAVLKEEKFDKNLLVSFLDYFK
ncbi:polyprenyl synthetase family protein [Lactobacillus terrae]|uniref:polyprenyl synthetase family protein n=1 Tax=Lactobacillus terrae TaxID=2269374 RepID=UPI000C1B63B1|nr:farnesyl diphosphate synthase [Lactobacillus terrae]